MMWLQLLPVAHRRRIVLILLGAMAACTPSSIEPTNPTPTVVDAHPVVASISAPAPMGESDTSVRQDEHLPRRPSSVRLSSPSRQNTRPANYDDSRSTIDLLARGSEPVTLNFVNADIRDVAKAVLGDILGVNYLLDPRVEGHITLQTAQPVVRTELLELFNSVIRSSDLSLIDAGGIIAIVPSDRIGAYHTGIAPQAGIAPGIPSAGILRLPLRYIPPSELQRLVAPFISPETRIEADPVRNQLLVWAPPSEVAVIRDFVELFDVDRFQGVVLELYRLGSGKASDIARDLGEVLDLEGIGPTGSILQIVPLDRINAILLASPQESYVERAKRLIAELATDDGRADARFYVYAVRNGRASQLAEVLGQAFQTKRDGVGARQARPPRLAPNLEGVELQSGTVEPVTSAEIMMSDEEDDGHVTNVVADPSTNSLLIRARPDEYALILEALEQLDVLPLQVLIEATIAEVSLNDSLRFGVEWFFRFGNVEANLSQLRTGDVRPNNPGFSLLLGGSDVRVVLNALEAVSDVKVISSPQLLVLDNQTARLQVGDQVPVAVQQAQSVISPDAPIVNAIEFRDTGVILEVTPRVNPGGLAVMDIGQEVSDVVPTTTSQLDSPTIRQRRISSTVAVHSGETVVLGGLIRENRNVGRDGVPILSSVPVLGALFGSRTNSVVRTELLVLITPRVVRSLEEARSVTQELRRRLHAADEQAVRPR